MDFQERLDREREVWAPLTFYERFEHVVILILTGLIAIVIVWAMWTLALKLFQSLLSATFDPTDYTVFQSIFGMIFTVVIALEFKRSLLVVAERRDSVVQVRAVVLLALLAVLRKVIILDFASTSAQQLLALAAAVLALGAVYWFVRSQDRSIAAEGFARQRVTRPSAHSAGHKSD